MRILGVDPGSQKTGWAIVGGDIRKSSVLRSGVIRLPPRAEFSVRMGKLLIEFEALVREVEPESAAVESPFHGKSSSSALQLAHARGVILGVLAREGVAVAEYSPATVKKSITGNGRADKDQVRKMIVNLAGREFATAPDDLTDAVAIALCHLATHGFQSAIRRSEARVSRSAIRPGSSR